MSCHFQRNFLLYITESGGIASVNDLKLKNDATYWKTVIPDKNQIHADPNFLILNSYIASLCYNNLLCINAPNYKG